MKNSLLVFVVLCSAVAASAATPAFAPDKTCVAWKTRKRMFMVKKVEPIGVNCAVKVEAVAEKDARRLRVSVPIASFDSGEPSRDKAVLDILKAKAQPELVFLSKPYGAKEWAELLAGGVATLDGSLAVAGADFPVSLSVAVADGAASGSVKGRFTDYKIDPPTVAGGVVAKVANELELLYRIPLALIPR